MSRRGARRGRIHSRDPRHARVLSLAALRWVVAHRAWTPYYLLRYWRFLCLRLRHPDVVTEGFVFLGKRVELETRPGFGRIVLGRWVHIGDRNRLRAHNGTLRLGDKVVLGSDNVVNAHLDIEIGRASLVSDWVYIGDFDHAADDLTLPIKDQGLVTAPVRIGPDCWIGVKASVLRGARVGAGCVLAAHTVVRGTIPDRAVVAGVPGTVRKRREADAVRAAERRRYREAIGEDQRAALGRRRARGRG